MPRDETPTVTRTTNGTTTIHLMGQNSPTHMLKLNKFQPFDMRHPLTHYQIWLLHLALARYHTDFEFGMELITTTPYRRRCTGQSITLKNSMMVSDAFKITTWTLMISMARPMRRCPSTRQSSDKRTPQLPFDALSAHHTAPSKLEERRLSNTCSTTAPPTAPPHKFYDYTSNEGVQWIFRG